MAFEQVKDLLAPGTISHYILRDKFQYFVDEVKNPLREALVRILYKREGNWLTSNIRLLWHIWRIVRLVQRYPEPTKENVKRQNTYAYLDVWDEFFQYDNNLSLHPLYRIIRRLTACTLEHDKHFSQRGTRLLEGLVKKYLSGEWRPSAPWEPSECWTEPCAVEALEKAREEFMRTGTIKEV